MDGNKGPAGRVKALRRGVRFRIAGPARFKLCSHGFSGIFKELLFFTPGQAEIHTAECTTKTEKGTAEYKKVDKVQKPL
jgi:hypothetical protein